MQQNVPYALRAYLIGGISRPVPQGCNACTVLMPVLWAASKGMH